MIAERRRVDVDISGYALHPFPLALQVARFLLHESKTLVEVLLHELR